jgi:putative transposase
VIRGAKIKTTKPDPEVARTEDLVDRQFKPQRRNQLWVVDFTYVTTWVGFVYVAFCIDVNHRLAGGQVNDWLSLVGVDAAGGCGLLIRRTSNA